MLDLANQWNANHSHSEMTRHVFRIAIIKDLQMTNIIEGVKQKKPSYTVGENVNSDSHHRKLYENFPKSW